MPKKFKDEETGEDVEAFLPEDMKAKDDALAAKEAELAAARADVEKYKKVSAEKTENFKKLNEMSEEERNKMSAKEIEDRKRIEAAESEVVKLREEKNSETQTRIKNDTEAALAKYHGGNEKLKIELEKYFKMVTLEGNDTATIQERARLAKNMMVGDSGPTNPLFAAMRGDSPKTQQKSKTEEFMKSDKAQEAMKRMGEKI